MRRCRAQGCGNAAHWRVRFHVWGRGRARRELCHDHYRQLPREDECGLRVLTVRRLQAIA